MLGRWLIRAGALMPTRLAQLLPLVDAKLAASNDCQKPGKRTAPGIKSFQFAVLERTPYALREFLGQLAFFCGHQQESAQGEHQARVIDEIQQIPGFLVFGKKVGQEVRAIE
jgi:hypothetical protein